VLAARERVDERARGGLERTVAEGRRREHARGAAGELLVASGGGALERGACERDQPRQQRVVGAAGAEERPEVGAERAGGGLDDLGELRRPVPLGRLASGLLLLAPARGGGGRRRAVRARARLGARGGRDPGEEEEVGLQRGAVVRERRAVLLLGGRAEEAVDPRV
jgi:hypothetical protein